MVIVWYTSGHGFGHASRDIEIINAIRALEPGCRIVLRTEVAPWLLQGSAETEIEMQRAAVDTGMAQLDSLTIDDELTARRAAEFYGAFEARIDAEARTISALSAAVVVGDIPPLAFAAARRAHVPSAAVGNFTWDWIYAASPGFDARAPDVLPRIRDAYAQASLALRLPFHGGFQPMHDVIRDIPLVARTSERGREETRRQLRLSPEAVVVLPSFGGTGLELPYDDITRRCDCRLVVTAREIGDRPRASGLRVVTAEEQTRLGLRYEDLVAAADVVVSKPGYGIVSECIANQTALLFTSRGRFVEQDVFLREMPRVLRCKYIDAAALKAGDWREPIRALLAQGPPPDAMRTDGAAAAAAAIRSLALH
jgi:L-arabinokinase